jgi:GT2 family glycosyltransferase
MIKDLVSVVFPTMNRKEDVLKCIDSIKKSTHKKVEIVIADNGSTDGTQEAIKKKHPDVALLESDLNLGSPVAINNCIKKSKGEFILRLDDDELVEKDTIEKMLNVLKRDPKIGAVSCLYFYTEEPNILRSAGVKMSLYFGKTHTFGQDEKYKGQFSGNIQREAAGGGSHLTRRKVFDEIGLYDESYFLSYEDIDWCYKLKRKGYKLIVVGSARLYHKRLGGLSQKENPFRTYLNNRGQVLFMKKNAGYRNLFFIPFFIFVSYPIKVCKMAVKKQFKSVAALTKGAFDALFNEQVFVYNKKGEKIPYSRSSG